MRQQPESGASKTLFAFTRFLRGIETVDRSFDTGLLLILALPLILLLLSDKWIYSPSGYIDAWLYNAYFRELPQILRAFPNLYHGTRLSWLMPGYVLYHIFPPMIANYVLHLGVYYVATYSLYFILKMSFNRYIALLTTILMGCYSYFLVSAGWDGVDGAGFAYFLLTLLLLTKAARSSHYLIWMVGAGIACAAFLYTNIYWIVMVPLVAAYFFSLKRKEKKRNLVSNAFVFSGAIASLTLVLGIINYSINGNFLFITPSLSAASNLADWLRILILPLEYWITNASWFAMPLVGLLSSILLLTRKQVRLLGKTTPMVVVFPALFISAFGILTLTHLLKILSVFQYAFYTSFLIPFLFLSFGAQLFFYSEAKGTQPFTLVTCATAILVLPFLFAQSIEAFFPYWQVLSILPAFLFGALGFLILAQPWELIGKTIFFLVTFSLANLSMYPQSPVQYTAANTSASYQATVDSYDAMSQVSSLTELFIWYQYGESQNRFYVSASAISLIIHANAQSRVSDNFPSLTSKMVGFYTLPPPGSKIAIFSTEIGALEKARVSLQKEGLDARFLSAREIHRDSVQYTITFIEVIVRPRLL